MFGCEKMVEKKLKEAIVRGEFDNLPGKGKPLVLEDESRIPVELRLANKILKNAGYLPEEVTIKHEISSIEDLLKNSPDEKEKFKAIKRLNYLNFKLATLRPSTLELEEHRYALKLADKLTK